MSPADDALDALARELPVPPPDPACLERLRTEILAAAGTITPRRPRSFGARTVAAAAVAAVAIAAAVVLLWRITGQPAGDRLSPVSIDVAAGAEVVRVSAPPDEVVYLRQGQLAIEARPLGTTERFRVTTDDAELEVRASRFLVAADRGYLRSVDVIAGMVELRLRSGEPRTLKAGERWTADEQTAIAPAAPPVDAAKAPAVAPPPAAPRVTAAPTAPTAPTRRARKPAGVAITDQVQVPADTAAEPASTPAPLPAAPGEREFRAGWDALKRGEPARAADSFAASRRIAGRGAIVEDAAYWEGVALARAGRDDAAIRALRAFLSTYPHSARAGEAAARLGWLLVEHGEASEAARWFRSAADDPVPSVRNSARSGLERVKAPARPKVP